MSVPRGFHPGYDSVGQFANCPAPAARVRSTTHMTIPRAVASQGWSTGMKNKTGRTTQVCVSPTQDCVSPRRVWRFLKDRHPQHTEKNTAQELSRQFGEDISPRTIERWRSKLPSSRHIILMISAWPDFLRVKEHEISESESRHARLTGALEELATPSNARNEWSNTTEEPSDGT